MQVSVFLQFDHGEYNHRLPAGEESPLQGFSCTRALLERTFRRRVLSLPNLTLRSGAPAAGLHLSPDGARVTGALMHPLELAMRGLLRSSTRVDREFLE